MSGRFTQVLLYLFLSGRFTQVLLYLFLSGRFTQVLLYLFLSGRFTQVLLYLFLSGRFTQVLLYLFLSGRFTQVLLYLMICMFLQHFDYFHYHSNLNFHATSKSLFIFGSRLQWTDRQMDRQKEGKPIVPSDVNSGRGLRISTLWAHQSYSTYSKISNIRLIQKKV